MKIIHTFFSLAVTILTVSCHGHNGPALSLVASQPGAAEESQFRVSLDLLEKKPENGDHWKQFFNERGASSFWRTLLVDAGSIYRFDLDRLQKEGVANEVGAGIIRYLAYHHKDQIKELWILGSRLATSYKLTSLDPAIGQLESLQALWLFNNQLQDLPAEIGQLINLRYLKLDNNQLQALPTAIGQLTNLKELWLQGSQLEALPEEIGQLTNLQALWLGNNQLQALPTAIGQLANLRYLELDNNQLQALPTDILQLTSLKRLRLSSNQLQALPAEILQLTSLETLYLSDNQLQALPTDILQLTSLKTLYLSDNQLQALPTAIGKLERLYLGNNQLTCLSEKLLPWYQQAGNRMTTNRNPWLKPADLSEVSHEELEDIVKPLQAFHSATAGMAGAVIGAKKFRLTASLLSYLLSKGRLNRDRRIVFFKGEIPFYLDRELYSQQDVQDLEEKELYRLPEAPSEQQ